MHVVVLPAAVASPIPAALPQATGEPANFYLAPARQYAVWGVADALSILIITGSFACGMAFHNTAARYFYSLGREKILPAALGRTHPRWRSPHVASITQSVICALIVIAFAIIGGSNDPTKQAYLELYGLMAIMGVIIILAVQALVSLAIMVYFLREHREDVHWFRTILAPVISFIGQAVVLVLLFQNISFIGGGLSFANWLGPIDVVIFALGIGGALYLRQVQPEKYKTVGRLINDGL